MGGSVVFRSGYRRLFLGAYYHRFSFASRLFFVPTIQVVGANSVINFFRKDVIICHGGRVYFPTFYGVRAISGYRGAIKEAHRVCLRSYVLFRFNFANLYGNGVWLFLLMYFSIPLVSNALVVPSVSQVGGCGRQVYIQHLVYDHVRISQQRGAGSRCYRYRGRTYRFFRLCFLFRLFPALLWLL